MKKIYKACKKFRRNFSEIYAFVTVVIGLLCMCFSWLFLIIGCLNNPLVLLLLVGGLFCISTGMNASEE